MSAALKHLNVVNGVICGKDSVLASHLNDVNQTLVPKIGVRAGEEARKNQPKEIHEVLEFLNSGLSYGFTLGLNPSQLNIYERPLQSLGSVKRFAGDPGLWPESGGNTGAHTLFSIYLLYHFYEHLVQKDGFDPAPLRESFRVQALSILGHDGGEGFGEFGTLANQINNQSGKDFADEAKIFEALLTLSAYAEKKSDPSIYQSRVIPLQHKITGLIATAAKMQFDIPEARDAWLGNKINDELHNLLSEIAEMRHELCSGDHEFIAEQMHHYDNIENFKGFNGSLARLAEKLEGTTHISVVGGYLDKIVDPKTYDPTKRRVLTTSVYMESKLHKIFADREPGLEAAQTRLAELMRDAIYEVMATGAARSHEFIDRAPHNKKPNSLRQSLDKRLNGETPAPAKAGEYLPRRMLQLHNALLYLQACGTHIPTPENPILALSDKPPQWFKKPGIEEINALAHFAKDHGLTTSLPARKGGSITGFAEKYMEAASRQRGNSGSATQK